MSRQMRALVRWGVFLLLAEASRAFAPGFSRPVTPRTQPLSVSLLPSEDCDDPRRQSYTLTREEINPLIQLGEGEKDKIVNGFGLWCAVASLISGPIWLAAMMLVDRVVNKSNPEWDPHRAIYDGTGKIWSKAWLTMTGSFPTVSGDVERLKAGHGPCLYVANHASWLDIPILCTVLDPVFKFIAKGELSKVPCIGEQLSGVSRFPSIS